MSISGGLLIYPIAATDPKRSEKGTQTVAHCSREQLLTLGISRKMVTDGTAPRITGSICSRAVQRQGHTDDFDYGADRTLFGYPI